jgi:peptidoglycan hydrolase-like protein with peptidoglycan-binding domain
MKLDTLRRGDTGAAVAVLQRRLNQNGATLAVDHIYGPDTTAAVRAYQRSHGLIADGIAGTRTLAALLGLHVYGRSLTEADLEDAAASLVCDVAAIQALIEVESPRGAYLFDGRLRILYERHIMYRQLAAAGIDPAPYAAKRPDIVNTRPGGYIGGAGEYARLAAAKQINVDCALAACSWGRFQILGEHWQALGYADVASFVATMRAGEAEQLRIFVDFVRADADMLKALQNHDWPAFAKIYNGPGYAATHYARRLAHAYAEHADGGVNTTAPSAPAASKRALNVPEPPPPADVGGPDMVTAKPPRKAATRTRKAKATALRTKPASSGTAAPAPADAGDAA